MVGVGLDACCHCAHAGARMKDQFSSSDVFFKDLKSLKKACTPKVGIVAYKVIEDMSIQVNVPALAIEEVAPLAVLDATMLAPEEIFHGKGNIKEEAELTKEERKRRRANQKRRFRRLKGEGIEGIREKRGGRGVISKREGFRDFGSRFVERGEGGIFFEKEPAATTCGSRMSSTAMERSSRSFIIHGRLLRGWLPTSHFFLPPLHSRQLMALPPATLVVAPGHLQWLRMSPPLPPATIDTSPILPAVSASAGPDFQRPSAPPPPVSPLHAAAGVSSRHGRLRRLPQSSPASPAAADTFAIAACTSRDGCRRSRRIPPPNHSHSCLWQPADVDPAIVPVYFILRTTIMLVSHLYYPACVPCAGL
ncbi:hypothetical protein ZIOFF_059386 [Zingiber officinale]|uniref:Uncharacterized protein n=1 Tax=Zingiber officinale TaxID=94328 RepID=A0A8J5KML0_ZINOF|nr:hypothetical protein ZIOFF_059386 [Zingiber officinale]